MARMTFQEMRISGLYNFPPSVDAVTTNLIDDWFGTRECTGDDKFIIFFNRALNLNYPYYQAMLRVDPSVIELDWFVENYSERQKTGESATNSAESSTTTGERQEIATTIGTSNGQDLTIADTSADAVTGGYSRAKALARSNPMSASYTEKEMSANKGAEMVVGTNTLTGYGKDIPDLHITNPTTTSDGLTENGTATNTVGKDKTITQTENENNIATTLKGDNTVSDSKTAGGNTKSLEREIYSGRSVLPSDVISKAQRVISGTVSWKFLYHELDKCFFSCYDYDID